jgi:hypothetical protein
VRGYDVVTTDDRVVGTVLDVRHGYLILESGRLRKTRHPVPREFVHVDDEAAKVFVTVPRRILMDAPRVAKDGEFDRAEAARHFGLAESYLQPPAEGAGDARPHDPVRGSRSSTTTARSRRSATGASSTDA